MANEPASSGLALGPGPLALPTWNGPLGLASLFAAIRNEFARFAATLLWFSNAFLICLTTNIKTYVFCIIWHL